MEPTTVIVAAVAMILTGLVFIYLLAGKKRTLNTPMEWFGFGLSSLLVVFAGVLLLLGFTMGDQARSPFYAQEESVGEAAPDFSFQRMGTGESASLDDYQGNVVLLNFWATWCAPCLDEMPDLNRLQEEYAEQGLVVLTLSDEHPETLAHFDQNMIPLDTESGYLTDATVLPEPFIRMLDGRPESYVIDRDGVIREFILGARNYQYFKQAIARYL